MQLITKKLTHKTNDPHYLVGGCKFYSKLQAFKAGQTIAKTDNDIWDQVKFVTNFEILDNEPSLSVRDLYCYRAQQLRKENEYIRIWASGGADSTNVIHAFHEANVKPNEIATYLQYPGSIHGSQNPEVDYGLRPLLNEIQEWWPDTKIKFYDVLPEHYRWYSENALEHWMSYTQLHPAAFSWQIPYEIYPELQEHSKKYQTANIYSGPDFSIGCDENGWYYRHVDKPFNDALNAPYQEYFYTERDLLTKMVHMAKKYIIRTSDPEVTDLKGEWSIKSGGLPEMNFWLNNCAEFGRKKNKAGWTGLLDYGPKGSIRFLNMISSIDGQNTLMNIMSYYKTLQCKYPHWFHDNNVMNDWYGIRTPKSYL